MSFDECMDDDSTARKMDKSLFFVKYVCNCGPNMFLLFRGYLVEFNHSSWLYYTMSRPFICLLMQMNIIGSRSKEMRLRYSSPQQPISTQKNEKKGAAKYNNCAGNKSKSFANIPVIPSFIADFDTQRWTHGQTTPNPTHRLSKIQFRKESHKTKTKMFRWFWQKL